jgi:hypothetical protein
MIEPPLEPRTQYAAGDTLEFGLVLIGRGIDYLPYFLFGFEQLGKMGLDGTTLGHGWNALRRCIHGSR